MFIRNPCHMSQFTHIAYPFAPLHGSNIKRNINFHFPVNLLCVGVCICVFYSYFLSFFYFAFVHSFISALHMSLIRVFPIYDKRRGRIYTGKTM